MRVVLKLHLESGSDQSETSFRRLYAMWKWLICPPNTATVASLFAVWFNSLRVYYSYCRKVSYRIVLRYSSACWYCVCLFATDASACKVVVYQISIVSFQLLLLSLRATLLAIKGTDTIDWALLVLIECDCDWWCFSSPIEVIAIDQLFFSSDATQIDWVLLVSSRSGHLTIISLCYTGTS